MAHSAESGIGKRPMTEKQRERNTRVLKAKSEIAGKQKDAEGSSGVAELRGTLAPLYKKQFGKEAPPDKNLALDAIEEFRDDVKQLLALRKTLQQARNPHDRTQILARIEQSKRNVKEFVDLKGPFQKAYREWMRERVKFYKFMAAQREYVELRKLLYQPSLDVPQGAVSDEERARTERAMTMPVDLKALTDTDSKSIKEELALLHGEGTSEYHAALAELAKAREELTDAKTLSKKEIEEKMTAAEQEANRLWSEELMVQYFYNDYEFDKMMDQYDAETGVIETPSVIEILNRLYDMEMQHSNDIVGGVLLGPPGTGKTTAIEYYEELRAKSFGFKNHRVVGIDYSEEVTRYTLFGTRKIEFQTAQEHFEKLMGSIHKLENGDLERFVKEHAESVAQAFNLSKDEAGVVAIQQIMQDAEWQNANKKLDTGQLAKVKKQMEDVTKKLIHSEIAKSFSHTVARNGWQDGIVIATLRRGDSLIINEFNKKRSHSELHDLLTKRPGSTYNFSDNVEPVPIQHSTRIYFTANIGSVHGVFPTQPALASRLQGKEVHVDYPPTAEEMKIGLVALADLQGRFLRSPKDPDDKEDPMRNDLGKLFILINSVFPQVRKYMENKKNVIPISYRSIRKLAEKLVMRRDARTRIPIFQPTKNSFDQAVYEILLQPYSLYEANWDKPNESGEGPPAVDIAKICIEQGLLLDPKLEKAMKKMVGEAVYKKAKEHEAEHQKDYAKIIEEIRGIMSGKDKEGTDAPTKAFVRG